MRIKFVRRLFGIGGDAPDHSAIAKVSRQRQKSKLPTAFLNIEELERREVPAALADLQGYWCDVQSAAAQWGQAVSVSQVQVQNAGQGAAGPFQLQWYLSRDQYGSGDD